MHFIRGLLRVTVTIKYTYPHGNKTAYQRGVPKDLRERYGKTRIKVLIASQDPRVVAREAERLTAQIEAEWTALRSDPTTTPGAIKAHADAYLKHRGLVPLAGRDVHSDPDAPTPTDAALELIHDEWDRKRQAYAAGDEAVYRNAVPTDYLTPVELAAWQRLYSQPKDTVSELMAIYLDTHRKRDDAKFKLYTERAFAALTAIVGDKTAAEVSRDDARTFIERRLADGNKTGGVRRLLNVFRAAWNNYAREKSPGLANPFEAVQIPGEGKDTAKRTSFSPEQLHALHAACLAADDDRRWLFAMMLDTGARLGEVTGLALRDIHLDGPTPFVAIKEHPWRSLKTEGNSPRDVPLIGAALWAARRIVERAKTLSGTDAALYAFPRYTYHDDAGGEVVCNTASASATLVKWIKKQGIDGLNHELRHTMIDRLREVNCPKEVRESIVGHGKQDRHDGYGQGESLRKKLKWLSKVAMKAPNDAGETPTT